MTRTPGRRSFSASRDPGCETAAADGDQHRLRLGCLLRQLEADRPLPCDDALVLERVHERRTRPLDVRLRGRDGLLERLAGELRRATVRPRRLDLRHRCVLRHEDRRVDAGLARGPRDGLAVVPGARGGHACAALLLAERRDRVVGAADLERARALEVLGLEEHLASGELRERLRRIERRLAGDAGEARPGGFDLSDRRSHRAGTPPP